MTPTRDERRTILQLARDAITAHVRGLGLPSPELAGILSSRGGAFVTVHVHGDLRGCIGHVEADDPIGDVIVRCAVSACSRDPRFDPITTADLPALEVEVSLLGPLEPIAGIDEVVVGRHGLVVERGWSRGLLLPQVASERHWNAETFLSQTCVKAGLPNDAWRNGAKIWRFEAEVFSETDRAGWAG